MKLLVDLNVILDVLLDRAPHSAASAAVWERVERATCEGYLSAHGVTTIHYIVEKAKGARVARTAVADLLRVFRVAPVTSEVLQMALSSGEADFEDAVSASAAAMAGCDAIVTRDRGGFVGSSVPAMSAEAARACIDQVKTS